MTKRIACLFCALLLCIGVLQPNCAAAGAEINRPCSLTLSYTRNGAAFSGLDIEIYRVAELCDDGEYRLLEPFSAYPIKIHGITSQQEWRDTAQTVKSFAAAYQIKAYRSQRTDREGRAVFTGLETGLYMVKGITEEDAAGVVSFQDFMVYLPTPVEGCYDYDVEAKPKYTAYTQPARYTVVKLWKDSGDSSGRPDSVCALILKDGVEQERVILNRENNWSYSWDVPGGKGIWSVMEADVPDGYRVSITDTEATFIITNSRTSEPPDKPDKPGTPDTPGKPGDPDDPGTPDTPQDPNVPGTPETPGVPGDPGTPKDPNTPGEPGTPQDPNTPGGSEESETPHDPPPQVPATGDTAPLLLYVSLLCVSGLGLMVLGALSLRDRRNEKNR